MKQQEELKAEIMRLVKQRGPIKTICPSEAARSYAVDEDWRPLMEPVRNAALGLAAQDKIEILQNGETIDLKTLVDLFGCALSFDDKEGKWKRA